MNNLIWAAHLAFDGELSNEPSSVPNASKVVEILTINEVQLLPLKKINATQFSTIVSSFSFRSQLNVEKKLYNKWQEEYHRIRHGLSKYGISHLILKSNGSFPYLDDNLDLLVTKKNFLAAHDAILKLGYIEETRSREPFKRLYIQISHDESFFDIHLHHGVAWHVLFMDNEAIWKRSKEYYSLGMSIPVMSLEDRILMNIAHIISENHKIRLCELVELAGYLRKEDLDWYYMKSVASKYGWLSMLYFGILMVEALSENLLGLSYSQNQLISESRRNTNKWLRNSLDKTCQPTITMPLVLNHTLCRYLYSKKMLTDNNKKLSGRIFDWISKLSEHIYGKLPFRRDRFLITLSGLDGSGKTTAANNIIQGLKACCVPARRYWTRIDTSFVVRHISAIMKGYISKHSGTDNIKISNETDDFKQKATYLENKVIMYPWLFINVASIVFQYIVKVRIPLFFGSVIVCDRYIYDAAIDLASMLDSPSEKAHKLIRIMKWFTPEPDLAFICDSPLLISYERMETNSRSAFMFELFSRREEMYNEIAGKESLRVISTESYDPFNLQKLKESVLQTFFNRYT